VAIIQARPVIAGAGAGQVLRLTQPVSFWGDVDPYTGKLTNPREAWHGTSIAGRVFVLPELRGSSSGSAVMLELLAGGHAPAALILGRIDAIIGLGILVAREMGWPTIPLLDLPVSRHDALVDGANASISIEGMITF
jgi:predicted aconitase with swiveling domain